MVNRLQRIVAVVDSIENVSVIEPFVEEHGSVNGTVAIAAGDLDIRFKVVIGLQYPFQFHDMETIRFINPDMVMYDHVGEDGVVCIHTQHSPDLDQKLRLDFAAVAKWIEKYVVGKQEDDHYEHVAVPFTRVDGIRQVMLFTDLDYEFKPGDFGEIQFSHLNQGTIQQKGVNSYILQSIKIGGQRIKCSWHKNYGRFDKFNGAFIFLEKPPVYKKRFIVNDWDDLNGVLPQSFVDNLSAIEQKLRGENYVKYTVLLGYPIPGGMVHWQLISIEKGQFPIFIEKIHGVRKLHIPRLKKQEILWGETRNCSYGHFFGRGALYEQLTNKRILIIGLGAIGSMVAQTLCRGGSQKIDVVDYDAKGPENICRSEYTFVTGINDKVSELSTQLQSISPFVDVGMNSLIADALKVLNDNSQGREKLREYFGAYDIIFDCTADNDMAFLIDQIAPEKQIINLSITNYAQELICAASPNVYSNIMHISGILKTEEEPDLYNPTGCWNPTFKAGYNDIAVLVQYAIKQINLTLIKGRPLRSFYLSTSKEDDFQIQIRTF
jgi:hypothetical protein